MVRILTFILWSIALVGQVSHSYGQILQNRVDISLHYVYSDLKGDGIIAEGDFRLPSLYNNFKNITAYSIQGNYKFLKHIGVGLEWMKKSFRDWDLNGSSLYFRSSSDIRSTVLVLNINSGLGSQNILNRLQLFADVGISYDVTDVNLVVDVYRVDNTADNPSGLSSKTDSFGHFIRVGVSYTIYQRLALSIKFGKQKTKLDSRLHNDRELISTDLSFGAVFRIAQLKRFYQ